MQYVVKSRRKMNKRTLLFTHMNEIHSNFLTIKLSYGRLYQRQFFNFGLFNPSKPMFNRTVYKNSVLAAQTKHCLHDEKQQPGTVLGKKVRISEKFTINK
jgi:hypothetical protein